ncbi:AAA family ATPase [Bradyrhizobium sp.]|uniref:AAA family ATPase n=1 Tax=Bradyrhizobium sp. TaxID=376 RepID=UPI00262EB2DB|nr:AAA family ATPase [Bradyrhizobium sp.]
MTDPITRRRLEDRIETFAVVIRVPTPAWATPVSSFFEKTFGDAWRRVVSDGARRPAFLRDEHSPAYDLAHGKSVVGISADLAELPSVLVTAADVKIEIHSPTAARLADAIERYTGEKLGSDLSTIQLAGLDFPDILSGFRKGSTPADIRDRLAAMSARMSGSSSGAKLPDLRDATEYGKAREWSMNLAKDIEDYRAGRIPWSAVDRGAVVFSPPGMGKSLWARMTAHLCGVPLIESNVASWMVEGSGYLNDVIRAQRKVFAQAAAAAPCLLFLDEIDAIPNRQTMSERNRDYWTPLVNDVLSNLDNAVAGKREGVIVIGATNHVANLDPALVRPGRLERTIEIEPPDAKGTLNILRHHVAGDIGDDELAEIAGLIQGSTGAVIMKAVRDARRLARQNRRALSVQDLREVVLPKTELGPDQQWLTSVHEAGHAIGALASGGIEVKNCVLGDGEGSFGRTSLESKRTTIPTKSDIENRVVVTLCGRAAEETVIGSASAGAGGDRSSDFAIATGLVCGLHAAGLMGDFAYLGGIDDYLAILRHDQALRRRVDKHLAELHERAIELMRHHRDAVETVARRLVERRHLSGDEIRVIYESSRSMNLGKNPDLTSQ